jgi:hypothetical protein
LPAESASSTLKMSGAVDLVVADTRLTSTLSLRGFRETTRSPSRIRSIGP